jgi:sensor c-di-GMP phosphodiesterase-like protein
MAVALPFLLAIPVIHHQAERRAEDQLRVVDNLVISQSENIVEHAIRVAIEIEALAGLPCEKVFSQLQQAGSLRPYFRTVSVIGGNVLYCSSVSGALDRPLGQLVPGMTKLPPGITLSIVPGTPLVQTRPALFVFLGIDDGRGVLASVDGQYLHDIIDAADQEGDYAVQLRIGAGYALAASGVQAWRAPSGEDDGGVTLTRTSALYPIEATAALSAAHLVSYRRALWLLYFPFLTIASALLGFLVHRLNTRRIAMATEIRRGIRRREFCVLYQPIVDLTTGACIGAEALMRWQHPVYGFVQPELFFPLVGESALAARLTRHLLNLIERDLGEVSLPPDFHLSVNLNAEHLCRRELVGDVERFLHGFRIASPRLVFELTERKGLPDTVAVLSNMRALRAIGVAFAIDDFGTGHSSLACLEKITVDYLKIAQGFVSVIDTDAVNAPVLELIISLGARLGVALIGEGIETEAQAAYLRTKGVKLAQGGLFSPPVPAISLLALM